MMTIGMTIRALRMGFGPAPEHGCFVRLSGDGPFKIEVEPVHLIPNNCKPATPFRVWWDKEGRVDLNQIEALRFITHVKRPFSFWINEEGKTVSHA